MHWEQSLLAMGSRCLVGRRSLQERSLKTRHCEGALVEARPDKCCHLPRVAEPQGQQLCCLHPGLLGLPPSATLHGHARWAGSAPAFRSVGWRMLGTWRVPPTHLGVSSPCSLPSTVQAWEVPWGTKPSPCPPGLIFEQGSQKTNR